jgi:hypothetical protein
VVFFPWKMPLMISGESDSFRGVGQIPLPRSARTQLEWFEFIFIDRFPARGQSADDNADAVPVDDYLPRKSKVLFEFPHHIAHFKMLLRFEKVF